MRKSILRLVYAIGVFLVTVMVMEIFLYRNNTAEAADMQDAVLPVLTMETGSIAFNELHGFIEARDPGQYRGVITPIDENRSVDISIASYGSHITSAVCEVRNITGTRLIEENQIALSEIISEGRYQATLKFSSLIKDNTEYLMIIRLSTDTNDDLRYYSRIIMPTDSAAYFGAVEFARIFHESTFTRQTGFLSTYLEPSSSSDNSSYTNVDIHSSMELVTWGSLNPKEIQSPVYMITDIQDGRIGVKGTYLVNVTDDGGLTEAYSCEEKFEIRSGNSRYYLLNFERSMSQIFDPEADSVMGRDLIPDRIRVGIANIDQIMESHDKESIAFVEAGRLYGVSMKNNSIAYIYGFAETDSVDRRETYNNFGIKILNVDDDCNIDFLVYGYMNRGTREGRTGVSEFYYNSEYRTIEEKAFISYYGSFETLRMQVEDTAYLNNSNELYLILNGSLYEIDTRNFGISIIKKELEGTDVVVCDDGRRIAWKELKDGQPTGNIVYMDLLDLSEKVIEAPAGQIAIPVGFLGTDFIYGLSDTGDLTTDAAGIKHSPMYCIKIIGKDLKLLETYKVPDFYISECTIRDNQITLHRVYKTMDESTGQIVYMEAEDDHIMRTTVENEGKSSLLIEENDSFFKKIISIKTPGIEPSKVRYIKTREKLYEGSREINTAPETMLGKIADRYYVYSIKGLEKYYQRAEDAIDHAAGISGTVLDPDGGYIWKKDIKTRVELENVKAAAKPKESGESSLEYCLDIILRSENSVVKSADELDSGKDVVRIMEDNINGARALNLEGLSLDRILYFISEGYPVIALTDGGWGAELIVGYGPENLAVIDPETGEQTLLPREEAKVLFGENGDKYFTYVKNKD